MPGVALFDRGPMSGSFTDPQGVELSYVIRSAEGTVDDFFADVELECGGWTVRASADFSRGSGTAYASLSVRGPEDSSFADATGLVRMCPVSLITDGAFPRDLGFTMSDCFAHALLKRLEALGLPELPEACSVRGGVMEWPAVDGRA
jgi:hypothetical protein